MNSGEFVNGLVRRAAASQVTILADPVFHQYSPSLVGRRLQRRQPNGVQHIGSYPPMGYSSWYVGFCMTNASCFLLESLAVVIIIAMTQFLALIFGRIRQPRVIAEVIGGVLLGPTVMGRIPNFKESIFPGMP